MSTSREVFVLIGPHAGKTMAINGHEFEDGEFVFHGSTDQIATLTNIFDFYGAVPAGKAREMAMEAELAQLRAERSTAPVALQPEAAPLAPLASLAAAVMAPTPTPTEASSATAAGVVSASISLGEAIGSLDPDAEGDWTSNNLPSLDRLAALVGKKPSRDEVEAIASGYTRAKAKAARA
jgi:hypothetical protein